MMTFPTISAGTRANAAIGGYSDFIAYINAVAAGVDSATSSAAGAALKANNLSDLTDSSAARTALGLGTMATATATDYLTKAGNLAGLADLPTARTNLGLGTAAVANTGTGASNVILGNDARLTDTRTPSAASIVDAMISSTLSPSKITGTAAILGANTFTAQQFIDGSSDQIQLRVQGHKTQTADFLTVENSAGTKLGGWDRDGQLNTQYVTDTTGVSPYLRFQTTSLVAINQGNAANVAFAVRGMAAQSGNLTEWLNSSSSVLASISAAGLGTFSDLKITTGTNVGLGASAHQYITAGGSNTALGWVAQRFITGGSYNTALGGKTNYNNQTGTAVVAVGYGAGEGVATNSHTGGTYVGYLAGNGVTTGVYNIALGYYAGAYSTNQSYEFFVNSINRTNRAGDIAKSIIYGVQAAAREDQTLTFNASVAIGGAASLGGGKGVAFIANANTVPTTDPSGGGILYVESGALKFRGSSGTITTLASP